MAWVRLDDEFAFHPKVMRAGPLGVAMQVAALCYCNQYETDGELPRAAAATLMHFEGLAFVSGGDLFGVGDDVTWQVVADILVASGVWHEPGHDCKECPPVSDGYYLHGYLKYQPSRADLEAEREAKRAAGRAGGRASAKARGRAGASASAQAEGQAESKPGPVPVPSSSSSGSSTDEPGTDGRVEEDEDVDKGDGFLLSVVCRVLAERALERQPPGSVKVERRWLDATQVERMERHRFELAALVREGGDLSVDELADRLEPDTARHPLRRVYRCTVCEDSGQVRNDDDLDLPNFLPCPNCNGAVTA